MRKMRLIIDVTLESTPEGSPKKEDFEIQSATYMRKDEIVDGFLITTDFNDSDPTSSFYLKDGKIVRKQLLGDSKWHRYIAYLQEWAADHSNIFCANQSPVSYQEWLDNEGSEEDE